ncbi:hypothetical protein IUY40_18890 [Flavobacterium sp. ALJ2]|uniref:hypothetical protein n=1 Tax=Flavobacterium sp. ALJ2 TaxID=2786960 RepID=UPI0018A11E71|nr:hypothetical protein [Flavobacterium sp. ALJ2]MBF7093602.1 hypothetical protein [Flavobacterium sp. ALJ2]
MAIYKICKNRKVTVNNDYTLIVGGTLTKIANQSNIEATTGNLTLISNKKITSHSIKQ